MAPPNDQNGLDDVHTDHCVFRAIADCTYDWESWHRSDGQLLWVNAAVERITGYSPEECLAMIDYPLPLVAEDDRDRIAEILCDAIGGGSGNDVDFQIVHRDGSRRWGAVSWQPMYDRSQQHCGFRASVRDVTERHQLREVIRLHNQHLEQLVQERTAKIAQLEEQRLKMEKLAALGQMAAGVAHEINNPLAGIRNAFVLVRSSLPPNDESQELLELIDSEIERISSITHQMYQLYRPNRQAASRFDLRPLISDVAVLVQPLATKSEVRIEVETREVVGEELLGPTEVVLREGELKQILLNVVRNAIQASPPGGVVTIRIASTRKAAIVSVVDEGPGVSQEVAARAFEPFFSTKTDTREGMGLGLSVSRSLAEAMGGTIAIRNNNGKGACVTVSVPRRIVDDERRASEKANSDR
ncbi:Sporulation kinase A [Maioricimonas rarisocia]|uniref:histidine kinase n=1 Tax=Maioricimonas rarisocia TaxID=2528026 RepID=A0A517Z0G6_9PLAN|nr:ATP-binding protein [Maioricimonas rarisocia]QDU35981.1 Sporulation kinase A [Maioricimonas rarisocia]